MTARLLRIRYPAKCCGCAAELTAGTSAWWDREAKAATCEACHEAPAAPKTAAGGSAQREYDRRRRRREDAIRTKHPRIGGLILALSDEPQSTNAWAKGANGERRVGASLDALHGVHVLHDRRIPRSRANIDHIVVTPTGVWVIDAKRYTGQVVKKDVGGWLRSDVRLYVGRRDCAKLVAGMAKQVDAVRAAIGDVTIPVRPVLCFIDAEWGWFAKPFDIDGVLVGWPKAVREVLLQPGRLVADIDTVAARLDGALRPAA